VRVPVYRAHSVAVSAEFERPVSVAAARAVLEKAPGLRVVDVVQAYAGGIRVDTLFIDEGFGSLDAETLEYALATLASLRDEGRVVGVISHVDEMQRAIPAQLRIVRRGDAVRTEIVGI
jgi:exonuclease SbcC